jgi:hypothetical protein
MGALCGITAILNPVLASAQVSFPCRGAETEMFFEGAKTASIR